MGLAEHKGSFLIRTAQKTEELNPEIKECAELDLRRGPCQTTAIIRGTLIRQGRAHPGLPAANLHSPHSAAFEAWLRNYRRRLEELAGSVPGFQERSTHEEQEHHSWRCSFLAISLAGLVFGQQQPPPSPGPSAPPEQPLSTQQLEDLAAPIALYPDTLLSQILVASIYPLEVVEAQQWLQQNLSLTGTKLMNATQHQNWDPSVQALVAFPDVLARLNQDVRWTTDLGNAFLAQQPDVMAAVQRLRARAQANGKLTSTPQEKVTTATENGQSAIQIQPVDPETVYVPDYNPAYVWGPPGYGFYPPLLYPPVDVGFSFFSGN